LGKQLYTTESTPKQQLKSKHLFGWQEKESDLLLINCIVA